MEDIIAEVITMWPLTIDLLLDILFPFSRVFYLQTRKQNRQVGDHRILSWNMGSGYIKSKRPLLLLLFSYCLCLLSIFRLQNSVHLITIATREKQFSLCPRKSYTFNVSGVLDFRNCFLQANVRIL